MREYVRTLSIGSLLRVRLLDGATITGILMAVRDDSIIVKPQTRIPEPERIVPLDTIDVVAPDRPSGMSTGKAAAIGAAAGAGGAAAFILILLAAAWD
jgi:hypothetical protein